MQRAWSNEDQTSALNRARVLSATRAQLIPSELNVTSLRVRIDAARKLFVASFASTQLKLSAFAERALIEADASRIHF